jgi:phosphoribosylanthranilate isomerase
MMRSTRVKICCIQNVGEAELALGQGAAALGLVSAMPSGPGVISEEEIASIVDALPPSTETFLLTSHQDVDAIIDQTARCGSSTLQLVDRLEREDYRRLREALPGVSLVQVIHVRSSDEIDEAAKLATRVDALLLDSGNPGQRIKELGGTGRVHDWGISRAIVERVEVPVFLAGGLRPSNVQAAIESVEPYGVDVCTGVRRGKELDEDLLAAFFEAVASADSKEPDSRERR